MREGGGPAAAALRRAMRFLVRTGLRGVWLRGRPPAGPFVFAANHHSWWDPFVAMVLLHHLRRQTCLLMWQQNLDRYGFARPLGIFGTGEHRRGLDHLRAGRVLVIYPEGELRPAGPPGPIARGAAWYADRAGVPLCAAAVRVVMRGHQAPEAYVSLVDVPVPDVLPPDRAKAATSLLALTLAGELTALDQSTAATDPRQELPGFARVVAGRRSWDERMDRLAGSVR
jgi:1-acyl-sn-glycerol-3-phosphate acyltransferase